LPWHAVSDLSIREHMIALKRALIFKWLLRGMLILIAWIVLHCVLITGDGLIDSDLSGEPADAAFVLGNLVMPDRSPSPILLSRLEKTLELCQKGAMRHIVCSGGKGSQDIWEAEAMRDWLVERGVPAPMILVDNEGKDSFGTAQQARKILDAHGWRTALIITSFPHITRCKLAFHRSGIEAMKSAHADVAWIDFKLFPHEFAGYYYYLVRSYD
jgi:uncharacterized SAM-binding protein YcdF (DUF218 family)